MRSRKRPVEEHVSDARLFRLAVFDNLHFGASEFRHLKDCAACFEQWKEYVLNYISDSDKQTTKVRRVA